MTKWLIIICLGTLTFYCQAETQKLSSAIKEVTVYNDRAAITRYAEVQLVAGEHELIFENLPVRLDDASLQVDAKATSATTILDVVTKQQLLISNANERLQQIEKQIETLQEQLAKLDDRENIIKSQYDFIKQMQNSAVGATDKANRPSMQQIQQIMELANNNLTQLTAEQRQLTTDKEQLQKQLQVLQNDRYPLQREVNTQVKNVAVRVSLAQSATVKIALTYVTLGASWYPIYDARFNSKQQNLSLNYSANVAQQTGEDWRNVKLTLSTARPALGGNAPLLMEWKLEEYSAKFDSDARARAKGRIQMVLEPEQSVSAKMDKVVSYKPALVPVANVEMSATSTAFTITEPTSLITGGDQQKVTINSIPELSTNLVYQIVPRLQQVAYLQADTKNSSTYPLLAGQLNIFMDGRFIATGQLKTAMPNEQFKIDLGADEAIKVTYKQLKRFTEKTGFTNSGERITYNYLITVQNNKNKEVKLDIKDHIPISQNEKIKVKLLSPKNISPDKEGKLNWQITLKPMEKQEIPVNFTIDYPVDTKVIGL
ncbi:mucoidy inhibitor MuiA family protein [Entomomonas asaccharolytica]|uniref:Mucoidy inhibitor MuiA family protein n=1 Tax=Entomomonas asaccharolytica TaxID=2785331 RepID=A0A974NFT7_9GAMM|nr:mucoidy inhibitor MuiA family protein [Entomomonas asaccharolytica]QQP85795.1 mucoidy inhibitor MuiA family protein [Entomomonas asaccharolytica]